VFDGERAAQVTMPTAKDKLENSLQQFHKSCALAVFATSHWHSATRVVSFDQVGLDPSFTRLVIPSLPHDGSIAYRDYDQNNPCQKHQRSYYPEI